MVAMLIGCGKKKELTFEGLPLSIWEERLDSSDPAIQIDALEVLEKAARDALPAEDMVRRTARESSDTKVIIQAVQTLEAMGAVIREFRSIIDLYNAPLIPTEAEIEEDEFSDDAMDEAELMEHASGDDDLNYLKQLAREEADTTFRDDESNSSDMIPTNPDELKEWVKSHQGTAVSDVLNMLSNPAVLKEMMNSGGALEQAYAVKKLMELSIDDLDLIEMMKSLNINPDSILGRAPSGAPLQKRNQ